MDKTEPTPKSQSRWQDQVLKSLLFIGWGVLLGDLIIAFPGSLLTTMLLASVLGGYVLGPSLLVFILLWLLVAPLKKLGRKRLVAQEASEQEVERLTDGKLWHLGFQAILLTLTFSLSLPLNAIWLGIALATLLLCFALARFLSTIIAPERALQALRS